MKPIVHLGPDGKPVGRRLRCECTRTIIVNDEDQQVHHEFPPCLAFHNWYEQNREKLDRVDPPKLVIDFAKK